ncbi:hypothetical protein LUZ63_013123 [Rhynchospora breviuscula]|uniref:RNase H type-1 domain-containing protein n=1 Tax=Rhynchospora breviuscula TaxID=2022672 RepID=A0A9Q0C809_9POAL|nr:hypothetical protein LUZ63_013123 [Rhynchospora breviuscula]
MKYLWNIAAESNALWAKVVRDKYLQRGAIWSSKRNNRCTAFWKAILEVRPLLRDHVRWQIGDGNKCKAIGQPWHSLWSQYSPQNSVQRKLLLADMINDTGDGWCNDKLIQAFGFYGALFIAINFPNGPGLRGGDDKLIFTAASNGSFTLKGAYLLLSRGPSSLSQVSNDSRRIYNIIWHTPGIMPRARVFMWKVVHEALPVDGILSRKLGKPPQGCGLCGSPDESVVHSLFKCPRAMQMWLTSMFGLRTDILPDSAMELTSLLLSSLVPAQIAHFISTTWQFWKCRCKEVFEGKKFSPHQVWKNAQGWTDLFVLVSGASLQYQGVFSSLPTNVQYMCYTDGSWLHGGIGGAGMAYVLYSKDGTLIQYRMEVGQACSPFHTEFLALKLAVNAASAMGFSDVCFYTDCLNLCNVINGISSVDSVDWQVYVEVMSLVTGFKANLGFYCSHISREFNQLADDLARFARIRGVQALDFTSQLAGTLFDVFM